MSVMLRSLSLMAGVLIVPLACSNLYAQTTKVDQNKAPLPITELRNFVDVFERVKSVYVQPIDDKTLMNNAIKGMLNNLDPHSVYLDSTAYKALEQTTTGQFGGLGIEIEKADDFIKIITPIDDSPAAKAGIQPGDLIIQINGQSTQGISLSDAVEKMRGNIGEPIDFMITRDNQKPFKVTIVRSQINRQSVKAQLIEPNYGYLRITQFQTNTASEVKRALYTLKRDNGNHRLQGLVLDLRNNPGGLLQSAVDTADLFMKSGLIVYTKGRTPDSNKQFHANAHDESEAVPLVILINSGSASASEVVAGALQDVKRAVIMGTTSFGKGSVQTILPIDKNHAVKLTTALYYTPNGRSIQAQGIVPDIKVEPLSIAQQDPNVEIREADLQNHLNNANNDKRKTSKKIQQNKPLIQNTDYQLNQALGLLKGIHVIGAK